tara:strand:+ start:357 stop:644 length:288 start_codon:yes stop_codon:yes gene_type:complete
VSNVKDGRVERSVIRIENVLHDPIVNAGYIFGNAPPNVTVDAPKVALAAPKKDVEPTPLAVDIGIVGGCITPVLFCESKSYSKLRLRSISPVGSM